MLRPLLKLSYVDDREYFPLTCLAGLGCQAAAGLLRKEDVRVQVINVVGVSVRIILDSSALCVELGIRCIESIAASYPGGRQHCTYSVCEQRERGTLSTKRRIHRA